MTMTAFDTLAYARKLKDAGVQDSIAEAQSEATAEIFHALIVERLATKEDLSKVEIALKTDIKDLEMRTQAFIVKAVLTIIGALGTLQAIFHFIK